MSDHTQREDAYSVLRQQAHDELDKCLDEARSGSLGWLLDDLHQLESDRVYSSVHFYAKAHAAVKEPR